MHIKVAINRTKFRRCSRLQAWITHTFLIPKLNSYHSSSTVKVNKVIFN